MTPTQLVNFRIWYGVSRASIASMCSVGGNVETEARITRMEAGALAIPSHVSRVLDPQCQYVASI